MSNAPHSLPLEKYAGRYQDERIPTGRASVSVKNGVLMLSFGEGALTGELEHWHNDVFRLHTNAGGYDLIGPGFATFTVDAAGAVAALSIASPWFKFSLQRAKP